MPSTPRTCNMLPSACVLCECVTAIALGYNKRQGEPRCRAASLLSSTTRVPSPGYGLWRNTPPAPMSLTWAPACMVPPAPYGADVASDALSVDVPHETRSVDREVEAFHASSFRDASCAAEPLVELPFEALVVREVRHIRRWCHMMIPRPTLHRPRV